MPASRFEQVAELAFQLPPEEQLRLVAQIDERLRHTTAAGQLPRGSADAVLLAARQPPHLDPADVDGMERAIAAGRLPVRQEGVFDRGGDG